MLHNYRIKNSNISPVLTTPYTSLAIATFRTAPLLDGTVAFMPNFAYLKLSFVVYSQIVEDFLLIKFVFNGNSVENFYIINMTTGEEMTITDSGHIVTGAPKNPLNFNFFFQLKLAKNNEGITFLSLESKAVALLPTASNYLIDFLDISIDTDDTFFREDSNIAMADYNYGTLVSNNVLKGINENICSQNRMPIFNHTYDSLEYSYKANYNLVNYYDNIRGVYGKNYLWTIEMSGLVSVRVRVDFVPTGSDTITIPIPTSDLLGIETFNVFDCVGDAGIYPGSGQPALKAGASTVSAGLLRVMAQASSALITGVDSKFPFSIVFFATDIRPYM